LSEAGKSFMRNSLHLKDMLRDVYIDEDCNMDSLDVVALKVSEKALEMVRDGCLIGKFISGEIAEICK